jgi:CDP-paratose 2-epimerase
VKERRTTPFGFVEWFRPGEHARVNAVLDGVAGTPARFFRTHLSWADFHAPGGADWYDWLIPTIARRIELLPCIHYTPPSISRTGRSSGAPRRLRDFADFVDHVLDRYGAHLGHVELWNEPNNILDWDWRDDPDWHAYCEMIGAAAYWAKQRGFDPILGGPAPFDAKWLDLMGERGVLGVVSAVGLHGFPGTWDSDAGAWMGWREQIGAARAILARHAPGVEVWITEAGYSTWRHDELTQAVRFIEALEAPADRLYWYGWQDIASNIAVQEGLRFDRRHYHLGLHCERGQPKLLGRMIAKGGVAAVRTAVSLAAPSVSTPANPIVVVGGAGFIGCNLADSYLSDGRDVLVVDNLARPGVERNLAWLKARHGDRLTAVIADVRDEAAMADAISGAAAVFHLAAQVAVTTSLAAPVEDFEINARGTLNVLEPIRRSGRRIPVVFASTNKVYGGLEALALAEAVDRYQPEDARYRRHGVPESWPLAFCTPYGCSKGVADQYVLDQAKTYGGPAAVLRMSCIYGPHQFGTEDQGWVAHFLRRALAGEPITLYGDGRQVRDILHVRDAVAAYRALLDNIDAVSGRAFNLGGGPANAVSLRQVLDAIGRLLGHPVEVCGADWRASDQLWFVADTRALSAATGWRASVGWRQGLGDLLDWLAGVEPLPAELQRATA